MGVAVFMVQTKAEEPGKETKKQPPERKEEREL